MATFLYQTAKQPNLFLFRLKNYDMTRKTEWITLIKAIKMIHTIAILYRILNTLI